MTLTNIGKIPTADDAVNGIKTAMHALHPYTVSGIADFACIIPNFVTEDEEDYLTRSVYNAPKPKWKLLSHRRLQNWGGLPTSRGMIPEELPSWLLMYIEKVNRLGLFPKPPNHVLVNEYRPGEGIMPHTDGPVFHPVIATINLGSHTVMDFYAAAREPLSSTMDSMLSNITPMPEEGDIACVKPDSTTTPSQRRPEFSLFIPRRSLLILAQNMYTSFLHGIREVTTDVISDDSIANPQHLPSISLENRSGVSGNGVLTSTGADDESVTDMPRKRRFTRATRISLTIRLVEKVSKFKLKL